MANAVAYKEGGKGGGRLYGDLKHQKFAVALNFIRKTWE